MDNNKEEKICVCCNCTDQITCLDEQTPLNKLLPEWFKAGICYEQQDDTQYFTSGYGIQAYNHLVFIIETKSGEGRGVTSISDVSKGRFATRIIVVDLFRNQEVELKLCPSVDHFDNLSRDELCSLWPSLIIPINQNLAILLLHKNEYHYNCFYVAWLVELQIAEGHFKPKHSLILWDQPGREVYCFGYRNLIDDAGMPICAFIVNSTSHDINDQTTHLTQFVGFNRRKLELVKQVNGEVASWTRSIIFTCLNGRTLNAFRSERIENPHNSWLLNLSELRIYSMDMEALQIKELKLPSEHEHEIGQKRLASNEIIRFGWSQNKGTVCLKCPPPYLHKFNLFVLDLTRLEWQHLDIDEAVSLSRFYRHLVYGVEIYVDGEDTIVVYGTHRIIKDSKWNQIRRFHRIHLRKPATLFELTYRHVAKMQSHNIKLIDQIVVL